MAIFEYPIHRVAPNLVAERKAKTDKAKQCILQLLQQKGYVPEKEVRFYVIERGHSDYAFWRARKELLEVSQIKVYKGPGAGNRRIIGLTGSAVKNTQSI